MKIRKEYTFTSKYTIWRLLFAGANMIVEQRDTTSKEVFFSCFEILSGKSIFSDLQLDEKFWIGIEAVYKDIIFFHKYASPDMPKHSEIIAFDINTQKVLWTNQNYSFLFPYNDNVYCYLSKLDGQKFFSLDCKTGNLTEELGNDLNQIEFLKVKSAKENELEGCLFPESFGITDPENTTAVQILDDIRKNNAIQGDIEFIIKENVLLFNYYSTQKNNTLENKFLSFDLLTGKKIFEEVLIESANAFVPDSFFTQNNFVFLLKGRSKLLVCSID
ncbi:MAG: DUF4905 domain-containing protein [Bacteroidota bacterium]|nr:DUF4905 domain-containing protein [Bacteroidota bacterium]